MPLHAYLTCNRRVRRSGMATLAIALAAGWPLLAAQRARADGDHHLILSLESYVDDATDRSEGSIGALLNNTDELEVGRGPVVASLSLAFLLELTKALQVGGGIRYLSSYRYQLDEREANDEDVLLGRLFEVFARGEYQFKLDSGLHLVPALELGLPLLFPSGSLQEQLDSLETTGYNVNSLPRIGFLLGGEVGVRFELESWLALRGAFGVAHEKLILFNASTDDDTAETSRTLSLIRMRLAVGAEASF